MHKEWRDWHPIVNNKYAGGDAIQPFLWRKSNISVCGSEDLCREEVGDTCIYLVLLTIGLNYNFVKKNPRHTFKVLTENPERICAAMNKIVNTNWLENLDESLKSIEESCGWKYVFQYRNAVTTIDEWVKAGMPGLWIGVTAEDQDAANRRIPILLDTPAEKHFVSVEPMLGPIDLAFTVQAEHPNNEGYGFEAIKGLDWVICGGESGPQARPMHPEWVRDLRDQCTAADVPFLFKQWGEWYPEDPEDGDDANLKVPFYWVDYDGNVADNGCDPDALMLRIGKQKAGREIDGVVWDQYPGQLKPQQGDIRCKDCRYGTKGPEGIRCSINGGLYPLHPEMYCVDAEEWSDRDGGTNHRRGGWRRGP